MKSILSRKAASNHKQKPQYNNKRSNGNLLKKHCASYNYSAKDTTHNYKIIWDNRPAPKYHMI